MFTNIFHLFCIYVKHAHVFSNSEATATGMEKYIANEEGTVCGHDGHVNLILVGKNNLQNGK